MPAKAARLVGVGAFVLGGLVLLTVALFMIGDRQMAFSRKFTVYTEFAKITGLAPGSIVRVSGAKGGTVKTIVPPSAPAGKFRVRLEITEELHPLVRTDSIASIETEGLVGGSYLAVGTGTDQAAAVPPDTTIPSREPFEISDLMQQMGETIKKVNTTIDDLQDDVQHAIVSVADTVDNANDLINDVSDDVKTMASAGARISGDVAEISAGIRDGKGTIGKLVKDDELYGRANQIARRVEEIAGDARRVVEEARQALVNLQAKDGPVQGLALDLRQTIDGARNAMSGFAENMEALKRNFLVRGFFKGRGYFDLTSISPAAYREGALTGDGDRRAVRVWLSSDILFEPADETGAERLSLAGKARLDSAVASYLDYLADAVLMVEGYSQPGTRDEQYRRSRARAALVREYLVGTFQLNPGATGFIPLGADSTGAPDDKPWDGVALAVFLDKGVLTTGAGTKVKAVAAGKAVTKGTAVAR